MTKEGLGRKEVGIKVLREVKNQSVVLKKYKLRRG